MESSVREPAVAGLFYPGDARECRREVEALLAAGAVDQVRSERSPAALIVPHAGYPYSGGLAALAYRQWQSDDGGLVAILGPNHRVPLDGMALDSHAGFRTPLGVVPVAQEVVASLSRWPGLVIRDEVHRQEHGIEVHLPFLQVLGVSWQMVPLVVGQCEPARLSKVIQYLVEQLAAKVLISSDLSHFLPYGDAVRVDGQTSADIVRLATRLTSRQACGAAAINGLNHYARQRHWRVNALGVRNSATITGDFSRVVGYGAYAYSAA